MTRIFERTAYGEILIVFPKGISRDDLDKLTAVIRNAYNSVEVIQAVREIESRTDQAAEFSRS